MLKQIFGQVSGSRIYCGLVCSRNESGVGWGEHKAVGFGDTARQTDPGKVRGQQAGKTKERCLEMSFALGTERCKERRKGNLDRGRSVKEQDCVHHCSRAGPMQMACKPSFPGTQGLSLVTLAPPHPHLTNLSLQKTFSSQELTSQSEFQ